MADDRIQHYLRLVNALKEGQLDVDFPGTPLDELGQLGWSLQEWVQTIKKRDQRFELLTKITEKINAGLLLDEVLNHVFEVFHEFVPYQRIGCSLLEDNQQTVRAIWGRSTSPEIMLQVGYSAKLAGSSLRQIIETGEPRILNDLEAYLQEHPASESTALMVQEGMRSSLTCPLLAAGEAIGFIFFSCQRTYAYQADHVELIKQVSNQLALIVEKSRIYERLVALNEEKNTLLGMAAHDLRGPITVILGLVELLQGGFLRDGPRQEQEIFQHIRRTSTNMLNLINNFLDISAIEAGHLIIQPQKLDLQHVLHVTCEANQLLAQAKAITLKLDLPAELPRLWLDPDRLNQIITNLISNAIKFSHRQSTITISAMVATPCLELRVQDQGVGIPAQELPLLFKPFGRGSVQPTEGEKSTGLGLAIVKRMVEGQGGSIRVESEVDQGTTFIVSFPLNLGETTNEPEQTRKTEQRTVKDVGLGPVSEELGAADQRPASEHPSR
jgi:signal transduction histidine kinase